MYTWQIKPFCQLTLSELYEILRLRMDVFMVEQYNGTHYPEADGYDSGCMHVFALDDAGKVVAYSRIIPPQMEYYGIRTDAVRFGRVATDKSVRGQGLGKTLISKVLECIEKNYGKVEVRISAQAYLIKFYQSFGFVTQGQEYVMEGINHIDMIRAVPA